MFADVCRYLNSENWNRPKKPTYKSCLLTADCLSSISHIFPPHAVHAVAHFPANTRRDLAPRSSLFSTSVCVCEAIFFFGTNNVYSKKFLYRYEALSTCSRSNYMVRPIKEDRRHLFDRGNFIIFIALSGSHSDELPSKVFQELNFLPSQVSWL